MIIRALLSAFVIESVVGLVALLLIEATGKEEAPPVLKIVGGLSAISALLTIVALCLVAIWTWPTL